MKTIIAVIVLILCAFAGNAFSQELHKAEARMDEKGPFTMTLRMLLPKNAYRAFYVKSKAEEPIQRFILDDLTGERYDVSQETEFALVREDAFEMRPSLLIELSGERQRMVKTLFSLRDRLMQEKLPDATLQEVTLLDSEYLALSTAR